MYAIRSYYVYSPQLLTAQEELLQAVETVITSYSIHYTKLYEIKKRGIFTR